MTICGSHTTLTQGPLEERRKLCNKAGIPHRGRHRFKQYPVFLCALSMRRRNVQDVVAEFSLRNYIGTKERYAKEQ